MPKKKKKKKKKQKLSSEQVLDKCLDLLQAGSLTVPEIVDVISNLIYVVGANIAGYEETGPGPEETMKLYLEDPYNIGYAMMAQGFQMNATWHQTLEEIANADSEQQDS